MQTLPENLTFADPRLHMTFAGRLLVRVITWITYLVLIAATFTFLISGIMRFRCAGVLIALILLDLFIHRKEGDMPIRELGLGKGVATEQTVAATANVARVLRPDALLVIERAFDASVIARRNFFLEMTGRLLEFSEIDQVFARMDISLKEFKEKLDEFAATGMESAANSVPDGAVPASSDNYAGQVELLAVQAYGVAVSGGHDFVEVGDLFAALAGVHDATTDRLFGLFSLNASDIERALIFSSASSHGRSLSHTPSLLGGFTLETHRHPRHRIMNRAWTSRPTPILDQFGDDLTDFARNDSIGFLIGHDEEYQRLVETLARPTNPNVLLVGDAGIGKEAIVQHLAFRLAKDDVPPALFDKRLVLLALQDLITGATPEVLDVRLKTIAQEIVLAGNIILYIPDIQNLVKRADAASSSVADVLMPTIMNNAFPVVGAAHPQEFKQSIEPRGDFTSVFEIIHVNEIAEADAEKILSYEALMLEAQSGVTISFGAVKRAVSLAKRYLHGKFLPASASELLKSAVVEAQKTREKTIGPDLVIKAAEVKTHIPIKEASGNEAEKLLGMEDIIHKRLIDQEEAVHAVATALREYRSGLARKGGPIASFLFVGPTGVGKTELAKILADIQFGGENGAAMFRFDMTEYQDKASFTRFIGSSDGGTRGALTDAVFEKPYSLILLDEFEKAFPDILNLFLQVLDDGRLTDGLGRTVDFTNTIIIATSNAHSDIINEALAKGESVDDVAESVKKRLVDIFKPELINRFSKVIVFKNLKPTELAEIVAINLREFAATAKEQDITLSFDPAAVAEIARLGYDPAFGARPLRRVIEEKIRAPLSEAILAKKIGKGAHVKLVFQNGTLEFVAE